MKISIITPVFNSAEKIEKNIKSIIFQNFPDFEHIIVDNLSSDNTIEIAKSIYEKYNLQEHLKIISEKDEGIADAFNKGINSSTGDVILTLNSDDHLFHNFVFKEVENIFLQNEWVKIVYGDIFFEDNKYGSNRRGIIPIKGTNILLFNHPALFLRKEVYQKAGLYDTNFKLSMDFDLYCRLAVHYPKLKDSCFYLEKDALVLMMGGGASWNNESESIKEIKKALKKNNLVNPFTLKFYLMRKFRTQLKRFLVNIKLEKLVVIWRNMKWKND